MCLRVSRGFTAGGRRLAGAQAPLTQQLPGRPEARLGSSAHPPGRAETTAASARQGAAPGRGGGSPGGPPSGWAERRKMSPELGRGETAGLAGRRRGQGAEQSLGTGSGGWEGQGLDHLLRSFSPGGAGGRRGASSHSSRRGRGLSTASSCSFDLASFCPPWGVLPGPHAIQPG